MSEDNVERHRRTYDAWNRRDRDAWLGMADSEIEIVPSFLEIEGGPPLSGREGTERLWDVWIETFPDLRFDVGEIRDAGDTTVAAVRIHGRGAQSDAPIEQERWHVMKWRKGKVIWFQPFNDQAEALETAGISE